MAKRLDGTRRSGNTRVEFKGIVICQKYRLGTFLVKMDLENDDFYEPMAMRPMWHVTKSSLLAVKKWHAISILCLILLFPTSLSYARESKVSMASLWLIDASLSPDGTKLALVDRHAGFGQRASLAIGNLETRRFKRVVLPKGQKVTAAEFDATGQRIYLTSYCVNRDDCEQGSLLWTLDLQRMKLSQIPNSHGNYIYSDLGIAENGDIYILEVGEDRNLRFALRTWTSFITRFDGKTKKMVFPENVRFANPELLDGLHWVQDNRVSIKAADLVVGAGEQLILQGDFDLVGDAKDGPELGITDIDDAMERKLEEALRHVTSDGHSIGDLFAFVIDGKSVHPLANRNFSSTPEVEGPDSVSAVAMTRDEILFATRGINTSLIYAYRGPDKDPEPLLDLKNSGIRVNHLSASSDGSTVIVITVNSMDLTGANPNTIKTNHAITVLKHWKNSDIIESILLED